MLGLFLAIPMAIPAAIGADDVVARVSTTGMAVRLALPDFVPDPLVMTALKRRLADRAVLQGTAANREGTVKVVAAFGETLTSEQWRERLLEGQLVGVGKFETGPVACTERTNALQPPYVEVVWHAFPTAADTTFDLSFSILHKGDESAVTRADFESIVSGARYAVLRLGEWDAMPAAVLERMHAGFTHGGSDESAGGAAWLAQESQTAKDGWACALAAHEVGMREAMEAAPRLELCDRVIEALSKVEQPDEPTRFALLTASTGRGLALRDLDRLDDALAELKSARKNAQDHGPIAVSAAAYYLATAHAARKEAPAAVAALRDAIAGNADWREHTKRDQHFATIGNDADLLELLKPRK